MQKINVSSIINLTKKLKITGNVFVVFLRHTGLVLLYLVLSMVIGHYYVSRLPENDSLHSNFIFVGTVTFSLSAVFAVISIPILKFTKWMMVASGTMLPITLKSIKILYITWFVYILIFTLYYFI